MAVMVYIVCVCVCFEVRRSVNKFFVGHVNVNAAQYILGHGIK